MTEVSYKGFRATDCLGCMLLLRSNWSFYSLYMLTLLELNTEEAPKFSKKRAEFSDRRAKIRFPRYYECQKSPKNGFSCSDEGSMVQQGAIAL